MDIFHKVQGNAVALNENLEALPEAEFDEE